MAVEIRTKMQADTPFFTNDKVEVCLKEGVVFWKKKLDDEMASRRDEYEKSEKEIRRLKRALWIAMANNARNSYLKWNLFANFESEDKLFTIDEYDETPGVTDFSTLRTYGEWCKVWKNVERKCRAKAEEYK